jgi:ABC-2 type transport system ATP-binding protein
VTSLDRAIVVDDVSKVFRIHNDPVRSVKERVVGIGRRQHSDFTALHRLTFDITEGQTVGILGHNGSGKSTLLKCIAGILRPSTGTVAVRGRLASLLELGAGFHPELTGRENVYINAAFLGIPRREIHARLDDIVEFAELGQFIDEPVKHYSSGMYVRLGFAVAVNLDPDILLVDEVLAVGDESFARKCINRVKQLQSEGRTIVVVTHAADTVRQVCNRAIVLDHGKLVADGTPNEAISVFRERLHGAMTGEQHETGPVRFSTAEVHTDGDCAEVRCAIAADAEPPPLSLAIECTDSGGHLIQRVNSEQIGVDIVAERPEPYVVQLSTRALLPGKYQITVRLSVRDSGRLLDWRDLALDKSGSGPGEGVANLDISLR